YGFASPSSGVGPRGLGHLDAIGLLSYVLVLRVVYMGEVELIPDEMYYWMYSQHLALSYLDHPPLIAWLVGAGTWLFGDTVFGVRAMLVPLSLIGAWYFYRYGATMGGRTAGLLCVMAIAVVPFFTISGILMTPDAPMIVAWVAALYYFKRSLIDEDRSAFIGLGLAMGLGLLAKYTIALLAPAAALFMLVDKRARHWFFRPEPYLSALLATLIFLPVLVWNWQNDWASFLFQGTRRLFENPDFASYLVVVYALLLLSPVLALACFQAFGRIRMELAPEQRSRRFMLIMTIVPLAVFLIYGLFTVIKFHWTLPAWIAMLPMVMVGLMRHAWPGQGALNQLHGRLMAAWLPSILVLVMAYGLLLHYFTLGLPGLKTTDFDSGYLGWEETAAVVAEIEADVAASTGLAPLLAGTSKWAVSAALAFHHPEGRHDHITAQNIIGMSGSMWEFWFDPDTDPNRPVILVNYSPKLIDEAWLALALVELGPLQKREIQRDGRTVRYLYYRVAAGFRPEQLRTPQHIPH
ncbi:MAG: glycosyltransferase family 39 protein, partial [Wenzhouxiangella sp.]|nr:glycosyltransferase family 39 protein [Wenzhouxiangella sp.]